MNIKTKTPFFLGSSLSSRTPLPLIFLEFLFCCVVVVLVYSGCCCCCWWCGFVLLLFYSSVYIYILYTRIIIYTYISIMVFFF